MNFSALRQLTEHWTEVMCAGAYLRQLHVARYPTAAIRPGDLYWMGSTLLNVANYLLRRRANPIPDGHLPAVVAGLYKASLGVTGVSYTICVSCWAGRGDEREPIDQDAIYDYADRNGTLIGTHEVCAASPNLIRAFLEVMVRGDAQRARRATDMEKLLPHPDAYLAYSTAIVRMHLVKHVVAVRQIALFDRLGARLRQMCPDAARRLKRWLTRHEPWTALGRSPDYELTRWIARQNEALRDRVVGKLVKLIQRFHDPTSTRVPGALFQMLRRPLVEGISLAEIVAEQLALSELEVRALYAIACDQSKALGAGGRLVGSIDSLAPRRSDMPAWAFMAEELGLEPDNPSVRGILTRARSDNQIGERMKRNRVKVAKAKDDGKRSKGKAVRDLPAPTITGKIRGGRLAANHVELALVG